MTYEFDASDEIAESLGELIRRRVAEAERKEKARLYRVAELMYDHAALHCSNNVVTCVDEDCMFEGTPVQHGLHVAGLVIELVEKDAYPAYCPYDCDYCREDDDE